MMMEMTSAQVLGFLLAVISTVGGIWLRRLHDQLDRLHDQLDRARGYTDRLQREILSMQAQISGEYCRRSEIGEYIARIEAKIDRLADKLDAKQDRVQAMT